MKGSLIKDLKAVDVRRNKAGKKLESLKTQEIFNMWLVATEQGQKLAKSLEK